MSETVLPFNAEISQWTDDEWNAFTVWLQGALKTNIVDVTFTKKDGTERLMKCTLNPEILPKVEIKEDAKPRKESTTSMRVFDTEKNEWRSFTIKSVRNVKFTLS
jgi:hypothetical protein